MIAGVWTEEEFHDTLIFAAVVGIAAFITTIGYRWLNKYLEMY